MGGAAVSGRAVHLQSQGSGSKGSAAVSASAVREREQREQTGGHTTQRL